MLILESISPSSNVPSLLAVRTAKSISDGIGKKSER
jgi:hypothetical protein